MYSVSVDPTPEQAVLGCLLLEGDRFLEVCLKSMHFLSPRNKLIYQAMEDLNEEEIPIDLALVAKKLEDKGQIEHMGGVSYLSQLTLAALSPNNLGYYETCVLEDYRKYATRQLATRLIEQPTDENMQHTIDYLQKLLEGEKKDYINSSEILLDIANDLDRDRDEMGIISSGFSRLDAITGGWNKGELTIIAGRPSMGKTAFVLSAMANCMDNEKVMVSFFSVEMTGKEVLRRVVTAHATVNGQKWRNPKNDFTSKDVGHICKTINELMAYQFRINDASSITTKEINAIMRKRMRKNPDMHHVVMIDYLQILDTMGNFERHDIKVGSMTKDLKKMATTLNIPVVCLSQLSRNVESRGDKRPMLSDLRDSGSIEQDADTVMFLYREDYYNRETTDNIIEISVLKQRNGATGSFNLIFEKETGRFLEIR